jgi:Raf kinase inhibitor-like YbhB/YbcL family protein
MNNTDNTLIIRSSDFVNGNIIPRKCTCEGENISPTLSWDNFPANTESFIILVSDPHKIWGITIFKLYHWIVYNIPGDISYIPRGLTCDKIFELGASQAINSFKVGEYKGPCPHFGTKEINLHFEIYALDITLNINIEKATKSNIINAMKEHILAKGLLIGMYRKSNKIE